MLVSLSHASLESKTMKRVHLNATILSNWKHPLKRKNSELHFGSGEAIAINYSPENGILAAFCRLISGEFYLEADATAKSNHYPIISDQNNPAQDNSDQRQILQEHCLSETAK